MTFLGGLAWASFYNAVWWISWVAFMRREWTEAMAAIGRANPFTAPFWAAWFAMILPIGVAIMLYLRTRPRRGGTAALAIWVLMSLGLGIWARSYGLSWRIIGFDSAVNLIALLVATPVGVWVMRGNPRPVTPS